MHRPAVSPGCASGCTRRPRSSTRSRPTPTSASAPCCTRWARAREVSSLTELVTAQRAGVPAENTCSSGRARAAPRSPPASRRTSPSSASRFGELALIDEVAAEPRHHRPGAAAGQPELRGQGRRPDHGRQAAAVRHGRGGPARRPRTWPRRHPSVRLSRLPVLPGHPVPVRGRGGAEHRAHPRPGRAARPGASACTLDMVDVGGGLGVAYFAGEHDIDAEVLTERLNPVLARFHQRHPGTRLVMELGRYLVGPLRHLRGPGQVRQGVDGRAVRRGRRRHQPSHGGGRHRVVRQAQLPDAAAEPQRRGGSAAWNITGPLCTPNDTIGKAVELPGDLRPGDLVGVERSGAYGLTASPVLVPQPRLPGRGAGARGPGAADADPRRRRQPARRRRSCTTSAPDLPKIHIPERHDPS